MNRIIFLMIFYCAGQLSFSQPSRSLVIDPTGTYVLKGERYKGEIKGNYGEIRVKLLSDTLLAITMYSNKGYPDYTSGSFTDTIPYSDNKAVYSSEYDSACQLVFNFDFDGLNIKQIYTDPNSTCGFGKGVMPLGFIAKYSSEIPIIQPLTRER